MMPHQESVLLIKNQKKSSEIIFVSSKFYMDIINHIILGAGIATVSDDSVLYGIMMSVIPDLIVMIGTLQIGKHFHRLFRIANNQDRAEWYKQFPRIEKLYNISHSLISLPLYLICALLFDQSIIISILYGISHILFDILTHTWHRSLKPLYPISSQSVNGFFNA